MAALNLRRLERVPLQTSDPKVAKRVRETPAGNEQCGAWRKGEHNGLVFAVALARCRSEAGGGSRDGDDGRGGG